MSRQLGLVTSIWPRSSRSKAIVCGVAFGAALVGLWIGYRRRTKRKKKPSLQEYRNGYDHAQSTGNLSAMPSAEFPPRDSVARSSTVSRHGRGDRDISRSSTTSNVTFTEGAGAASTRGQSLSLGQDALIYSGVEYLSDAIRSWRQAVSIASMKRQDSSMELCDTLEGMLDRAEALQEEMSRFLAQHCPESIDGLLVQRTRGNGRGSSQHNLPPMTGGEATSAASFTLRKTMSILSDDSFMSALDEIIPIFDDVDVLRRGALPLDAQQLVIYQIALKEVKRGRIPCRVVRTDTFHCSSDEEFLAKLHCLREAFRILLCEEFKRDWLTNEGRDLIGGLMKQARKDPSQFFAAYAVLLKYIGDQNNWASIEEELRGRNVPMFTFYDVVLDFILMDAFDDLARPPASALAVAQNRFLSDSFKESTLATVVWSVLKAKRARLQYTDGFISHFYDVSEQVSPTMAWGFLGTDSGLRELCYFFKDQICCFVSDIFSFERVRFTSYEDLSEDVWLIMKRRAELTKAKLNGEALA